MISLKNISEIIYKYNYFYKFKFKFIIFIRKNYFMQINIIFIKFYLIKRYEFYIRYKPK